MRETKTTNPQLIDLIYLLKKESREKQAPIWLDVADHLAKSRSQRVAVNLSKLNRHTKKAEVVVIPGKLLASGSICLLYTSDAADEEDSVDLGGRRIIKK